jgi:methionine-gamma-lyase
VPADFPPAEIVKRQMTAGGGLVAFELRGGLAQGRSIINALEPARCVPSVSENTETLVEYPVSMTHPAYSAQQRAEHGILDGLIRMSIGLENTQDILRDLNHELS